MVFPFHPLMCCIIVHKERYFFKIIMVSSKFIIWIFALFQCLLWAIFIEIHSSFSVSFSSFFSSSLEKTHANSWLSHVSSLQSQEVATYKQRLMHLQQTSTIQNVIRIFLTWVNNVFFFSPPFFQLVFLFIY